MSSQASKELSTASFKVVRTALVEEEKPTCWRFLEKYSAVLLVVILGEPLLLPGAFAMRPIEPNLDMPCQEHSLQIRGL